MLSQKLGEIEKKKEDDGPKKSKIFGARTALVERAWHSWEEVSGKMAF